MTNPDLFSQSHADDHPPVILCYSMQWYSIYADVRYIIQLRVNEKKSLKYNY